MFRYIDFRLAKYEENAVILHTLFSVAYPARQFLMVVTYTALINLFCFGHTFRLRSGFMKAVVAVVAVPDL